MSDIFFSPFVLVESGVARRSFHSLPLVVERSLVAVARSLVAVLVRCHCVWPSRCCACGRAVAVSPLRVVIVVHVIRFRSPSSLVTLRSTSLRTVVARYVPIVVVTSRRCSLRTDHRHYVSLRAAVRCRVVAEELWRIYGGDVVCHAVI